MNAAERREWLIGNVVDARRKQCGGTVGEDNNAEVPAFRADIGDGDRGVVGDGVLHAEVLLHAIGRLYVAVDTDQCWEIHPRGGRSGLELEAVRWAVVG